MTNQESLAQAFKQGDHAVFGELIESYQERLYRLAYRITTDADDALDVVQEAFIKIHRSIEKWNQTASFYSWAYRITSNLAIDVVRRRGRDRKAKDRIARFQGAALGVAPSEDDPLEQEEMAAMIEKVRDAIEQLPPGQRSIVALRHYEGLSLNEIAEIRDCAVGTVKSTLHQAFRKLRTVLKKDLEAMRSLVSESL
jgi:RNA polymerase sigma-70 factor, ECF subfamily